jgi:hypothetical protein
MCLFPPGGKFFPPAAEKLPFPLPKSGFSGFGGRDMGLPYLLCLHLFTLAYLTITRYLIDKHFLAKELQVIDSKPIC